MSYRMFQKLSTGLGLLITAIGGACIATTSSQWPKLVLAIGVTLVLHGLVALAFIQLDTAHKEAH